MNMTQVNLSSESYMHWRQGEKQTILIVDDSDYNREMLTEILVDEYNIMQARNGIEAIAALAKDYKTFSAVLLDLIMPAMDGFEVLQYMNSRGMLDDLPVIIISSDNSAQSVAKVYELGVSDFISRPFDFRIVRRRVSNVVKLYEKQKKLVEVLATEVVRAHRNKSMLNDILCHVVEFRNTESGSHVRNIKKITQVLLFALVRRTSMYHLTSNDISAIVEASGMHDIGKIAVPESILNKPDLLTPEEFEIIKSHSAAGSDMIASLTEYQDEPLIKYAYQICRWHHERFDGTGYPDKLAGNDIPIAAQIVSLADVYDALTAQRAYKPAYSKEKAVEMILNGECGSFNPFLLECFIAVQDEIDAAKNSTETEIDDDINQIREVVMKLLKEKEASQIANPYTELATSANS